MIHMEKFYVMLCVHVCVCKHVRAQYIMSSYVCIMYSLQEIGHNQKHTPTYHQMFSSILHIWATAVAAAATSLVAGSSFRYAVVRSYRKKINK